MRLKAFALALLLAYAAWIVVPDICATLTPDNWFLWWLYECGKDAAGGGGSGAG